MVIGRLKNAKNHILRKVHCPFTHILPHTVYRSVGSVRGGIYVHKNTVGLSSVTNPKPEGKPSGPLPACSGKPNLSER